MRGVRRAGAFGGSHGNRSEFGSSEACLVDPFLLPRLKQYAYNNQVSNIDATVEYLRRNYPEYRRKQQGPFRKFVIKAVHILKKRSCEGALEEELEDRFERRASALRNAQTGEEIPQEIGTRDIMRSNTSMHFDNSSENSDGVESEGISEGNVGSAREDKKKRKELVETVEGRKGKGREATRRALVDHLGRRLASGRKRVGSRKERSVKDASDSEEELAFDGLAEASPSFNLLNSSLRATYNGRPSVVLESSLEKNGLVASSSSSLFKFRSLPKLAQEDRENLVGESSGPNIPSTSIMAEDARAFASPSVVAEAARAALLRKKSRKAPVIDQETNEAFGKGSASGGASTEKELYRGSPPAQSSGRPPQSQKSRSQLQSPAHFSPEAAMKLQNHAKVSIEIQARDGARSLERGESGVGIYESSGQVMLKRRDRDNFKVRSSKRRKSDYGGPEDGGGVTAGVRTVGSTSIIPQNVSFKDLGGIEETIEIIREIIEYPLAHPELYEHLGVQPPRGVLLHGPPGCGKTMLANAIAAETGVPFLKISAPEVVSGMSGESEAKVRALFAEAVKLAPCIIFIDEIDAITPKRETAQREMERRIVAQLLTCMDDLSQPLFEKDGNSLASMKKFRHVIVIGATNRPDALDPALRRAGRFDREIALGIPDEKARARVLSVLAQKLRLDGSFDFNQIAKRTPGFVGADLAALVKEAAAIAVKRIFISRDPSGMQDTTKVPKEDSRNFEVPERHLEDLSTLGVLNEIGSPESASVCKEMDTDDGDQAKWRRPWTQDEMDSLSITMQDFEAAVTKVQPSAKREGFATIPDVTWDDVGSLGPVREELEFSISRPIKYPEEYQAMGLDMATGVLLYGPPGCGKTLVAKAIANDAGANFISVKGPELLNKYVGESERAVRQLFTRARASAPCVLFFDEMDAMAPRRGNDGNGAAERVVNQLLTEMDGLESRKSIFIIAATNRADMIDPALLRPGRLDKLLYVPLPDAKGRGSILRTLVRKVPLAPGVDVVKIGESERCDGFSGADLASLVREACIASLRERMLSSSAKASESLQALAVETVPLVYSTHFDSAFARVFPSVSDKDRMRYDSLCKKLRCARGNIQNSEPEADVTGNC